MMPGIGERKRIVLTVHQLAELADQQAELARMVNDDGKQGLLLAQVRPLSGSMTVAVVEHDVAQKIVDLVWRRCGNNQAGDGNGSRRRVSRVSGQSNIP